MSKELKEFIASDLRSQLSADGGFVAVDYQGLDAELTVDLRKSLREVGGRVVVVQNRLAKRVFCETVGAAAENGGAEVVQAIFRGPTALVIGDKERGIEGVLSIAKAVSQWRKKNADKLSVKGGYFLGEVIPIEKVALLAALPDQETLYSQVAGLFQSPLRDTVTVAQQTLARVVYAMSAYKDKLESEGEG